MTFYRQTDFKETPIGEVPEDWEVINVGKVVTLKNGERPKIVKDGGFPVYGANGVMGYSSNFSVDNDFTIIIGRVGASGEVHLAEGKIWISDNAIYSERYDKDKAHPPFVYYLLKFRHLAQFASKTTHPIITQSFLNLFPIQLPPLLEQQKIAEVLSTMDEAIQKTNEVIAKTERLKKGLMQELLTKGIGHKEFKDTEIGRIPKEWVVVKLEQIVEINKESRDPSKESPNEEFLYIDIDSIEGGTGIIGEPKRIIGKNAPSRARRVIHPNNVIMSTVRPYLKAFAMVPKEYDNQICSTGFAVFRSKEGTVPHYLLHTLFSCIVISQCNRMMMGGQYPALNNSQVAEIRIPFPPPREQQKIGDILSTVDKKLELERKEKAKLERIKQGLMDLLLTGKIRVKVN
ncbi:hypothetical protein ES703_10070 [subsurface metagenome]